jgi:hypothetical protein
MPGREEEYAAFKAQEAAGGPAPGPPAVALPIDETRRNKSPGIQNNFFDTDVADFKRPYGFGRSPAPPPPAAQPPSAAVGTVDAAPPSPSPPSAAAPESSSSSGAVARDTAAPSYSEMDRARDEVLGQLHETLQQQQSHISELSDQLYETLQQQQLHISELTDQNSDLMRTLVEKTEELSEVLATLTPAVIAACSCAACPPAYPRVRRRSLVCNPPSPLADARDRLERLRLAPHGRHGRARHEF